jgi:hypothetical protein
MSQDKRLPQVGEKWWMRDGRIADVVNVMPFGAQPVQTENERTSAQTHARGGEWIRPGLEHEADLILIHSDATGKVINPTFNGGVPMAAATQKVKLTSQDPLIAKIADTVAQLEGLTELRKKRDELHEAKVKTKRLTEEYRELKAKWMPEAKKAGKKVK